MLLECALLCQFFVFWFCFFFNTERDNNYLQQENRLKLFNMNKIAQPFKGFHNETMPNFKFLPRLMVGRGML